MLNSKKLLWESFESKSKSTGQSWSSRRSACSSENLTSTRGGHLFGHSFYTSFVKAEFALRHAVKTNLNLIYFHATGLSFPGLLHKHWSQVRRCVGLKAFAQPLCLEWNSIQEGTKDITHTDCHWQSYTLISIKVLSRGRETQVVSAVISVKPADLGVVPLFHSWYPSVTLVLPIHTPQSFHPCL